MSEPVARPKLDHAINAAILLGWFCLRTGDRWLLGFDERVRQCRAGRRHAHVPAPAAMSPRSTTGGRTNYTLPLAELSTRLRRLARGAVHRLSRYRDRELMIDNVTRLARRHLCCSSRSAIRRSRPRAGAAALARALHQAVSR